MAINKTTRRVMVAPARHPEDVAADQRIRETLDALPWTVKAKLPTYLWDGRAGERAMREALAELGLVA